VEPWQVRVTSDSSEAISAAPGWVYKALRKICEYHHWLVVSKCFKHLDYFPFHIWDNPEAIDELIFFKMVETTNQTILDKGKSSIIDPGRSYIIT
jgi:hypothetical protein